MVAEEIEEARSDGNGTATTTTTSSISSTANEQHHEQHIIIDIDGHKSDDNNIDGHVPDANDDDIDNITIGTGSYRRSNDSDLMRPQSLKRDNRIVRHETEIESIPAVATDTKRNVKYGANKAQKRGDEKAISSTGNSNSNSSNSGSNSNSNSNSGRGRGSISIGRVNSDSVSGSGCDRGGSSELVVVDSDAAICGSEDRVVGSFIDRFVSAALATLAIGFVAAIVVCLWYYMGWIFGLPALLISLLAILLTKPGWRWFYIAGATSKRDLKGLFSYVRILLLIRKYEKKNLTISDIFHINVAKYPDKLAVVSETQSWTFRQMNEYSNRIANLFHSHGYKKGDIVGLLLENRPEYVAIWLGLSKIGIIIPLINTNLRGPSLVHSITVAHCSALVYGESFVASIESVAKEIPSSVALYQYNDELNKPVSGTAKDLATLLESAAKDKIPSSAERANHHDKLLYIYTSGTTGLPKAAVISHSRYLFIAAGIHFTLGFQHNDVFYTPLPLYHTAGGTMSIGQALIFGSTVAIRKKFSASGYFSDCIKFNCTIGQYIGEMARYILATPASDNDRQHNIRLMFGNGLRPQIWPQFVERFSIANVGEFYGATEGNANIMNIDNKVGAIGFMSRIFPSVYPISIIRADPESGEPVRGANGLCQLCGPNEPGIFVGKIIKGNPSREFLGYVDEKASAKKIVHNVFKKGDMAFLSGDILVADEKGYLFFKDRTGDTYRWKGENVSTSEVEAQVSNVAGYKDTIVYGVTVPNAEGRAGMAAIYDPERQVNLEQFAENLSKVLPNYARPQFLRFLTKVDLTGTFKLRKIDLQKDNFDPNRIRDALYYQTAKGKYEPLTLDVYERICKHEIKI